MQVYIRTGKGRLSQEAIDRVIERMRPLLRNQQYGQALREVIPVPLCPLCVDSRAQFRKHLCLRSSGNDKASVA